MKPGSAAAFVFFKGLVGYPRERAYPNPRRTLQVVAPGYAGMFVEMTADTDDVATFDLSQWLAALGNPAEIITDVSMTLAVMNLNGATDPTPNDRQTGVITVTNASLSQRYGNFQPDIDYIQYRVKCVAETNLNNRIAFWAYLPVDAPVA